MTGETRAGNRKRARRPLGRGAVSPAIATMFVLVIVFGLTMSYVALQFPTIQQLDADSQYKTTLGYFIELDNDISRLSLEPEGSTRDSMLPAGSTGQLGIRMDEQAWVFTYQYRQGADIRVEIAEYVEGIRLDAISNLRITTNTTGQTNWSGWQVDIYWPQSDIEPSLGKPISPSPASQVAMDHTVQDTMRVIVRDPTGAPAAGAWIFCSDSIYRDFSNSQGSFKLREEMGAVTSDYPDRDHVENAPGLQTTDRSLALEAVQFDGSASASKGRYNIHMTSRDKMVATEKGVYGLELKIYGPYEKLWYAYLTNSQFGQSSSQPYGFTQLGESGHLNYETPSQTNPTGQMDFKVLSTVLLTTIQAV